MDIPKPSSLGPFVKISFAAALCTATIACSKHKSDHFTVKNNPGGDNAKPASFDIPADSVAPEGCLNLQLVYEQLTKMPEQTYVRELTNNFEADQNGRARGNFRKVLTRGAFAFLEQPISRYRESTPSVAQNGCNDVTFSDPNNPPANYKIIKSTRSELVLEAGENERRHFVLVSERSLSETEEYMATDFCAVYDSSAGTGVYQKVPAKRTLLRRWGPLSALHGSQEKVSVPMLRTIAESVVSPPAELLNVLQNANGDQSEIMTELLRKVASSEIQTSLHVCPRLNKPPEGTNPQPPEEPGTPEEVETDGPRRPRNPPGGNTTPPDTGPNPQPNPEPSPQPSPRPAPEGGSNDNDSEPPESFGSF